MNLEEIKVMAQQDGLLSNSALDKKLIELKAANCSMLLCIVYAHLNQNCSLNEAKSIVCNSFAFATDKYDFINHQREIQEEAFQSAEAIEMVITPTGTTFKMIR